MKRFTVYCWLFFYLLLAGCSSSSNSLVSRTYHNITARYNAYFIANEQMKEIDQQLADRHENNYNKVLQVFPEIDSAVVKSSAEQLEDIIQKASLVIQRHKNSNWVGDSYNLVGKARYYQGDFVNAINTFKYVNTSSDDDQERHEALILLIRTFMDAGQPENAVAVSDYLKKEKLKDLHLKELSLTRAFFYQRRQEWDKMLEHMQVAAPLAANRTEKARIYYILGQLYQMQDEDAKAYRAYKKCLRSNPEYEMTFYARLNSAQAYKLAGEKDLEKARKFFRKLLEDSKNKEYKDKIYYEMAEFEMELGNLEKGMDYYRASARSSVNNQRQKAYAYLRLGQIYYDTLSEYRTAKNYYDSTTTTMPADMPNHDAIQERQKILEDFVKQLTIIEEQDSLLRLADMDSVSLMTYLQTELDRRKAEREKQEEKARRRQEYNPYDQENNPFADKDDQEGAWYFYNTSAMAVGRAEFNRKWGDRELEDNWRRSNKQATGDFDAPEDEPAVAQEGQKPEAEETQSEEQQLEALYNSVPRSGKKVEESRAQVEEAYYNLGNIYNFELKEKRNAAETFTTLLERFPQSEYRAEVLYLLYLIHQGLNEPQQAQQYAAKVQQEFPDSIYDKLIENPQYKEENKLASAKVAKIYAEAYSYFNADQLDSAKTLINQGLNNYPENDYTDNLQLLEILIIGKQENFDKYQYELSRFIEENPESELNAYAQQLLETYQNYQKRQAELRGIKYEEDFDQKHHFVLIMPNKAALRKELTEKIEAYIKQQDPSLRLTSLVFGDQQTMLLINNVADNKPQALEFYKQITTENGPLKGYEQYAIYTFVMTKKNFQTFYQNKRISSYVNFFDKHYLK